MGSRGEMRALRIQYFTRSDWSGFQLLQEKRWWGWKTIDREDVPAHVRISLATCGDAGGWQSKFIDLPVWS
jgi:hypothetical protein